MRRSLLLSSVVPGALVCVMALALGACGGKSLTGQECGDGLIEGTEVCDSTALDGQDCTDHGFTGGILACAADCGEFDTSECGDFVCGNGLVETGESCEATDLDGQTCTSRGFDGGTLACTGGCDFDTSGCIQPGCGDGVVSSLEVCDGTNLDGEDCGSQGFTGGVLACAATCGAFNTSGCTDWLCGDGVVETPEVCDGSNVGAMGCVDFGFIGGALVCTADCMDYNRAGCTGAGCGNGIREPGEVCDQTDLGGLTCQDYGYDAGTLACSLMCDTFDDSGCFDASCGDGTADGAEPCDGGDLRGADCVSIAQGFVGGTLACDGTCAFNTTSCTAAPPPGDDCANAGVIPPTGLPVSLAGDTTGQTDDYNAAGGDCPGMNNTEGDNHPDVVYEFTPATGGVYTFALAATGFDGALYIVTDCADIGNTCVEGSESDNDPNDRELLDASLVAGTAYYIIVDGGANWGTSEGTYTLAVDGPCVPSCAGKTCGADGCGGSCGTCTGGNLCDPSTWACADPSTLAGEDCTDPIVVPGTPYTTQGITTGRADDYTGAATCPGLPQPEGGGSADVVYEFTPTQTGMYHIDYEPTFDGALYVVTNCADVAGTCIGGSEEASFNPPWNEVVDAPMVSGTTYYIIVDGGYAGFEGTYTLSIDAPCLSECTGKDCGPDGCGASCGACTGGDVCDDTQGLCLNPSQVEGEDCTNPVVVDTANLPFVHLEDTTGSTDTADHSGGVCPGENGPQGVGAGDHAFELSPAVDGVYEISLTTYGWDGVVYVVTDCADIDNTCVFSDDDVDIGTETMHLTLDATETYYIIVDGFENSGEEGSYQLYVGQPCIPQCAGLECGDDGCGGVCGTCPAGEECDPSQQCQPIPGNTCTDAIVVGAIPYNDSGDTGGGFANDYTADAACPGIDQDEGESSPDVVYAFTPTTTGDYTITYVPTFDGTLYVVTDCGDVATTCLEASEAASYNPPWDEVITLTLTAGTTYYIILDGGVAPGASGAYTLDIQ
jgi:hypothetical protein